MYQSLYKYFYTMLASSIFFKYDCNTVCIYRKLIHKFISHNFFSCKMAAKLSPHSAKQMAYNLLHYAINLTV